MQRGDLVTVATSGDYGRPRPAVIVQSDAFPEAHASIVVCPLTSDVATASEFRITIEPHPENGLRLRSQIIADKPLTVRRDRIGKQIGRLSGDDMAKINAALAFVMGLGG